MKNEVKISKNFEGLELKDGVYYYSGDLKINGDLILDGDLIVAGNLIVDGDLIAIDVIANIVTVNGNATAGTIRTKLVSAKNIKAENIVGKLAIPENGNISVSGKIYAPLSF